MEKIFPQKLQPGDEVRIITPSRSLGLIPVDNRKIADDRFAALGLKLSFGQHVNEKDEFASSSIESRVADMHAAFSDKNIKAIITVIGGFNSNQLLRYLDWNLIKQNPKIFCGYSDITVLNNAILAKTGLVSYSGPHYSTFSQKLYFDYTLEYFKKCLFSDEPFAIEASQEWSDDVWYMNQEVRNPITNEGFWVINEGQAEGTIVGANLCTLNLLQGTEYFPDLTDSLLFLEDDNISGNYFAVEFDRNLQSLIHQSGFSGVKAVVIGRFQKTSEMSVEKLTKIIKTKKELANLPVIANVDFGHTDPKITFPIGGTAGLTASNNNIELTVLKH